MRRVDAGLAGRVGLALTVVLVVTLALAAVVSAQPQPAPQAPQIPSIPAWFYGNVATDRGKLLPAGTVVTARRATGPWTGTSTTTLDALGKYGWDGKYQVPGYDPAVPGGGCRPGDQIKFEVLGVQARLYDVATKTWSDTYPFENGKSTNLNLEVAISYTILATKGPNGSITPSGAVNVDYGFDQLFTIAPDPNYLILDVKVDNVSKGAITSYTFPNVTETHTIDATFVKATYEITPTAGAGCTITPPTKQIVPYLGSATFTIAANAGYKLTDVKVDETSQGVITSYTFPNVVDDHTIAATCTPLRRLYLPLAVR